VEHFLLSRPLIAALRRDELSVTTGTVNDAALLRRVAALGVDAVTTDDPRRCARGSPLPPRTCS
jgi:glycerophosphoryl diester phosphodiesterase